MASRLRISISPKISFFSFQDIITSVTGILILVALMLSLHVTQGDGGETTSPDPAQIARLQTLDAALKSVTASNVALQQWLAVAAEVSDPEALGREVAELRRDLAQVESATAVLRARLDEQDQAARRRAAALGLTAEATRNDSLRKTLENLRLTNDTLATEVRTLRDFTNQAQPHLGAPSPDSLKVWLIPEAETSRKQAVIVEVSGSRLVTQRFGLPETRKEASAAEAADHLAALLNRLSSEKDYLLFYLRPSGITLFERCLAAARDAGFDVGYDALEEDQVLVLQNPSPP
jgi:hypothetical protein